MAQDSKENPEELFERLLSQGPIGRLSRSLNRFLTGAAAQCFSQAAAGESERDACIRASDALGGGWELYLPLVREFMGKGMLQQSADDVRIPDSMEQFLEDWTFRSGIHFALTRDLMNQGIARLLAPVLGSDAENIAIWGVNELAEPIWAEFVKNGRNVVCFIDQYAHKFQDGFCGRPVKTFEQVCEEHIGDIQKIVICSRSGGALMAAQARDKFSCHVLFHPPAAEKPHVGPSSDLPRLVATTIPKSGTHLLGNILNQFPGLNHKLSMQVLYRDTSYLKNTLESLDPGDFMLDHVYWSAEAVEAIKDAGAKVIFMMRDPRDVLVSLLYFYLFHDYTNHIASWLRTECDNDGDRLMALINGVPDVFESRCRWLEYFVPWADEDHVCVVRFEELVGERGGADDNTQRDAVMRMSDFLGIELSQGVIDSIKKESWRKDAATFRKGRLGQWKELFSPAHRDAFKQQFGRQLVEMGYEKDDAW